jgi:hypothetical protein
MKLIALIYLAIGVVVAAVRNYFERLDSVKGIGSLLIAILIWPVVVFDVNVRIGDDDRGGGDNVLLPFGVAWAMTKSRLSMLRRGREARSPIQETAS